ncbi:MAG: hypothetical protein WD431_06670, partial [Cyclobacteriaceae bacterium]
CTAAPIFAWIIIHNREQDSAWHWKGYHQKEKRKGSQQYIGFPAIKTWGFKGPGLTAIENP